MSLHSLPTQLALSTVFVFSCAPPNPMGDGATPTDATPPPADVTAPTTRPPVYPVNPPVTCSPLRSSRLTVPAALAARCLPWVGMTIRHFRETRLRFATASACAQVLLIDPTATTQPPPFDGIPPDMPLSETGVTPVLTGFVREDTGEPLVRLTAQLGSGLVAIDAFTTIPARLVSAREFNLVPVPEPGAQWVHLRHGDAPPGQSSDRNWVGVIEIPQRMADGTFEVQRRFRTSIITNPNFNLSTIRRRIGTPQEEGATFQTLDRGVTPVVCAAADGKIIVDYYDAVNRRLFTPVELDTGDPEIQRCTLASINGTLVGIASSPRRSIAFAVDLFHLPSATNVNAIRPFPLQPYLLPPSMVQLGADQGPFDVAVYGSVFQLPSGLAIYGRRANATSPIETSFGFFDRSLDYDSAPLAVDGFLPLARGNDELTTAAIDPNGQVAFARYSPSTGRLEASTMICTR